MREGRRGLFMHGQRVLRKPGRRGGARTRDPFNEYTEEVLRSRQVSS